MTDQVTNVILVLTIPALYFLMYAVDRWASKQAPTAMAGSPINTLSGQSEPLLPFLDIALKIIMFDPASGKRYVVHFGVESVQMVEE